ncbi:MAG TPA: cupin domain-containing protein [Candidatus Baltobacteraceae bacterium]|nr:cupin domain-containing protein [Candidatus Baltobacteraceae bacterium]
MRFSVSHLDESSFESGGLRPQYEYRDLGIKAATGGKVGAHVIRVVDPHALSAEHHHDLEFQMIYILKGWVVFRYDGVGDVRLEAGSCAHQPPGIKHEELAHSDDLEILEITLPADFATSATR